MTSTKQHAAQLLRKYDQLRKDLREVERDLAKAVTAYGRESGYYGLSKDMFRIQMENEERIRLEMVADQSLWEQANA